MGTSAAGSASAAAGGGKDHKSPWQETLLDLLRESGFSWSDLVLPDDMQENVTVKAMPERSRTLGGVRGRLLLQKHLRRGRVEAWAHSTALRVDRRGHCNADRRARLRH